jgi:hyperosmotically inducible periplasmic protein
MRMRNALAVMILVGGLTACSSSPQEESYAADNSGKNVRDRKDAAVTSGDQSNSESDLAITQEIRKAVVADAALSTNAQNVKIVTVKGIVTLRGPVKNAGEKANVGTKAQQAAGVTRVDNEIEIASD